MKDNCIPKIVLCCIGTAQYLLFKKEFHQPRSCPWSHYGWVRGGVLFYYSGGEGEIFLVLQGGLSIFKNRSIGQWASFLVVVLLVFLVLLLLLVVLVFLVLLLLLVVLVFLVLLLLLVVNTTQPQLVLTQPQLGQLCPNWCQLSLS